MQDQYGSLCRQTGNQRPPLAEDAESDPSTEFGSDGAASELSDDDYGGGNLVQFAAEDTILIFDWDDTLLPTTWIEQQGLCLNEYSVPSLAQESQLQEFAEHAVQTLQIAKAHGTVLLVTNAEHGWVELSCQKFMPSLYPYLRDVKILSARSTYEQQGVAAPSEWKYLAFQSEIDGFCEFLAGDRRKNVISIGDSLHEREALIRVAERMPSSCCMKAVKLMTRPEVEQLQQQHELISGCFHDIVNHDGNLDLSIGNP